MSFIDANVKHPYCSLLASMGNSKHGMIESLKVLMILIYIDNK